MSYVISTFFSKIEDSAHFDHILISITVMKLWDFMPYI